MKRAILAMASLSVLLILLVVATVVAFLVWNAVAGTSKGDVERMLRENLPPGSSAEEVVLFLESESIEHSGEIFPAGAYSVLVDAGLPRETEVIGGIIRNTSHGIFYSMHISFWLILDGQRRVVDYHLEEAYDGL